ncbi:MAG TPA: transglycosylase SLT domain-containing protein [Rhodoblastus sp.]|nr:transglycosylase SLT domain-containing protein [Rhodoblastus sp.]
MKQFAPTILAAALAAGSISGARADDTEGRFWFQNQGMQVRDLAATPAGSPAAPAETARAEPARGRAKHGRALGYETGARGSVRDIIARHAAANGVPFKLADAVVRIESRYNPRVSNGGALGLMQIKPATARGVGFAGSASALYNAETNVTFGMRYLAQAYRMSGGDVCGTVMRYQSGHYSNHMNAANRAYCSKARAIMASN